MFFGMMQSVVFTNDALYRHLREKKISFNTSVARISLHNLVTNTYSREIDTATEDAIRTKISVFCSNLYKRWNQANRTQSVFEKTQKPWLKNEVIFPEDQIGKSCIQRHHSIYST